MRHRFETAAGNPLAAAVEIDGPLRPLIDADAKAAALQFGVLFVFRDFDMVAALRQFEMRTMVDRTGKMDQLNANHTRQGGVELHRQQGRIDHIAAASDRRRRCGSDQCMVFHVKIIGLHRSGKGKFVANQPVAIGKFHLGNTAFLVTLFFE
ncbi:hypothetical protein D3C76_1158280 [compost metagenome]